MDQTQPVINKRGSILKRHSSFNNNDSQQNTPTLIQNQYTQPEEQAHVSIDSHVQVIEVNDKENKVDIHEVPFEDKEPKEKVVEQLMQHTTFDIRRPSADMSKLSEAELVKLSLKQPQIWEENDEDSDESK